jgi:hypothetical protein
LLRPQRRPRQLLRLQWIHRRSTSTQTLPWSRESTFKPRRAQGVSCENALNYQIVHDQYFPNNQHYATCEQVVSSMTQNQRKDSFYRLNKKPTSEMPQRNKSRLSDRYSWVGVGADLSSRGHCSWIPSSASVDADGTCRAATILILPTTWESFIDDTSVSDICYDVRSYQQQRRPRTTEKTEEERVGVLL